MGVIRTDRWLDESFFQPEKICEQLTDQFNGLNGQEIYSFLRSKGMYKPNQLTKKNFDRMKERKLWEKVKTYYTEYKRRWNGPEIPIYLFPTAFSLFDPIDKKQGFTFPNQMFLFLSPTIDDKELEAVFVHEYHHATRMHKLNRPVSENNLADSVAMEGLAEFAVWKCCGESFLSKWVVAYPDQEIEFVWKKWFEPNLSVNISDPLHDQLLYGFLYSKPMFGYAAGFYFVKKFDKRKKLSMKQSFTLPSNVLIQTNEKEGN
ncbi:DUF2268 domain-containing protein [Fervidibacillus albus]|uniref:DUF2268 domain-containing protein n=1 Tax=Fervidibacillus albus TaxID=2980026 RepID=A0A9E8LS92_9BACI|nr:DUF2268 domain-containing putative Zn-dependent protease [Fervidibacillus albus]WAA08659.1 DUF2268 domain-containing protein [Fervidibacillus albus]